MYPSESHLIIPFLFLTTITHSSETLIPHTHKLVYTQCSNLTSPNPSHSSLLPILFQQFITHSSQSTFSQTIVANESFQCMQHLSSDECKSCVDIRTCQRACAEKVYQQESSSTAALFDTRGRKMKERSLRILIVMVRSKSFTGPIARGGSREVDLKTLICSAWDGGKVCDEREWILRDDVWIDLRFGTVWEEFEEL